MLRVSSHLTFWPKEGSIAWFVAVWFPIMLRGCKTKGCKKHGHSRLIFHHIKTLQVNEWAFAGRSLQFNLLLVDHPKCLNATDGGYLGIHSLITLIAVSRTQSYVDGKGHPKCPMCALSVSAWKEEHISMAIAPSALWSGPWREKVAMETVRRQLCDRYSCAGQDKGTEGADNSGLMPIQKYARGKTA